jgi:hypothetical protein
MSSSETTTSSLRLLAKSATSKIKSNKSSKGMRQIRHQGMPPTDEQKALGNGGHGPPGAGAGTGFTAPPVCVGVGVRCPVGVGVLLPPPEAGVTVSVVVACKVGAAALWLVPLGLTAAMVKIVVVVTVGAVNVPESVPSLCEVRVTRCDAQPVPPF